MRWIRKRSKTSLTLRSTLLLQLPHYLHKNMPIFHSHCIRTSKLLYHGTLDAFRHCTHRTIDWHVLNDAGCLAHFLKHRWFSCGATFIVPLTEVVEPRQQELLAVGVRVVVPTSICDTRRASSSSSILHALIVVQTYVRDFFLRREPFHHELRFLVVELNACVVLKLLN